jgi:hypothetical protein
MITQETREAIDAGLGYLAKQQAEDGSWGMRNYPKNVGITSLAGLAFLSAGRPPGQVPHGEVLARAIDYILKRGEERHLRLRTPSITTTASFMPRARCSTSAARTGGHGTR